MNVHVEIPDASHDRAAANPSLEVVNRLAIDGEDQAAPLPLALRTLVAIAVNSAVDRPICVVLPDVEGVAEVIAAIAALVRLQGDWPQLAAAFINDVLRPGAQLRSVRDGKIIQFVRVGQDFVHLRYLDAKGSRTNATLIVPRDIVFGLEPTGEASAV